MDNLTLSAIIKNNIGLKNLEGNRDIVVYDEESGAYSIEDIALEMGATYDFYITSAVHSLELTEYGQQKITIKLISAETTPDNYDLYVTVNYFDVFTSNNTSSYINISKDNTELWTVLSSNQSIKIYKIVKKAV